MLSVATKMTKISPRRGGRSGRKMRMMMKKKKDEDEDEEEKRRRLVCLCGGRVGGCL